MNEVWKSQEEVLPSANLVESVDSARQNGNSPSLNQLNSKAKERIEQCKRHAEIESKCSEKAEKEFEDELKIIGIKTSDEMLTGHSTKEIVESGSLSTEDKIKTYKEELVKQGKTAPQILKSIIAKYEDTPEAKLIVANCKSFLKLSQYSGGKSITEKRVIQNVILNADFTTEDSFETALTEIQNSTEISSETKTDLQRKFGAANISSVSGLDTALSQIKEQKDETEKQIEGKEKENKSLKTEISDIEKELKSMPINDSKREELKALLKQKQEALNQNKTEIKTLEEEKPESIIFTLRDNFLAQQNPNGSRIIRIDSLNFDLKIPDNKMPFQGQKNRLAVNLAFTFNALNQIGMDAMFSPRLKSGEVPDKQQRLFGSRILKQLGYPTDQILSQSNIYRLEKDLNILKKKGGSTGSEDLQELGILNEKLDVNFARFDVCLSFIRGNRDSQIGFEEVKMYLNNS